MDYLNIEKGIKKVYISQIFAIIAALLIGCTELVTSVYKNIIKGSSEKDSWIMILSLAVGVVLLAAVITSNLIGMIGYYQASKDDPLFKKSMYCALTSCILTVVGELLQIPNGMLYTVFTASAMIVEMFVMVFAIAGLVNLSESQGRSDLSEKGDRLLKLLAVTYIISAVNALIIRIFELSAESKMISFIINVIDSCLIIIRYILYLRYLKGNILMLNNNVYS